MTPLEKKIVICALREYADGKQPGFPSVEAARQLANSLEREIAEAAVEDGWTCQSCGRDYDDTDVPDRGLCPAEDCPSNDGYEEV